MIIVIGGIKGGTGKTTIATNLAVINASYGKKTLLIDTDDHQRTLINWSEQRNALQGFILDSPSTIFLSGSNIHNKINQLAKDYDDIIIDVGGRESVSQRSALTVADRFVIPFQPSSFDLWTARCMKNMVDDLSKINNKLETFYVLNRAVVRDKDIIDSMAILSELKILKAIPTFIFNRKAYRSAASVGLGVIEYRPLNLNAFAEMTIVYKHIYNIYN